MRNFLILFTISILFSCSNGKSSDKEKEIFILGFLISAVTSTSSSSTGTNTTTSTTTGTTTSTTQNTITCINSTPAFSSLASAGTTSNCATCHSGNGATAGFDVTQRSSVLSRVISGNPESSLLYIKITTGSMRVHTTSTITNAIYCWIKGGALP